MKRIGIKYLHAVVICSITFNYLLAGTIAAQESDGNEDQLYVRSLEDLNSRANTVTHDYDIQVGKWERGEHNNTTMVSITDSYIPKFKEVIAIAKNLQTPAKFENVTKLYLKSLESELQSEIHFRNNLESGNATEAMLYEKLRSDALNYEIESFKAAAEASTTTTG